MGDECISDRANFIIYACPVGELNNQLEAYFSKSLQLYGENSAHKYMPHCTLTGFFSDNCSSIPFYFEALARAYKNAKHNNLSLNIKIKQLTFNDNWHGLELQADGLKELMLDFTQIENSPTRTDKLRLKDWLHLSLAYDFDYQDGEKLKSLAEELIDLNSKVNWELRFYQKNPDWSWNCLQSWSID
ncbi:MAG: hypothetical protein QNJ41_27455 [Xenococcaceae cyanobacterium MO_188.B32]|nr:hypothetical protein [Xenococcaceae cyanobacterium MO_188.B32]